MKIMVVDDDAAIATSLRAILSSRGYDVKYFNDSSEALEEFKKNPVDIVLADLNMPRMDGFQLINELKDELSTVDIVVITGYPTTDNAVKAMKSGAYDFIRKPFEINEIDTVLERLRQRHSLIDQLGSIKNEVVRLEEINRRLDVLNQLKENFIGNVSHELRTPLAIMTSAVSLLKSGETGVLPEKQKNIIDMIDTSVKRLNNIIETIFDLTFSRNYKFQISTFSAEDVLNSVIEQFMEDIAKQDIKIGKDICGDMNISYDARVLGRVFFHILSNAVKFNKKGGSISIKLARSGSMLSVKITDTGIGISEEERRRVFDRFYQVDGSMTRAYGGAGIGLAAVKKYMDIIGGKIDISSSLGEGSTFTADIPLELKGQIA